MKTVLAFDFGASSGRAVLGRFDGEKIRLDEIHRFSNDPVAAGGTFYWDILRLFHEIKRGILKAKALGGFDSVGIDTWGVDFGLFDKNGYLLENPVHYRDGRTAGMIRESEKYVSNSELYDRTGIQLMDFNTVFQLLSIKENRPELLDRTDKILFIPDIFTYFLTGEKVSEYTEASTSQLININTRSWDEHILNKINVPKGILPPIVEPCSKVGVLSASICGELGVNPVPVIAVCEHDTASAIAAIPAETDDFAFLSSGTWSLMGSEIKDPIVDDKAKDINITNEGGINHTITLLKNICGLWLIQESRRQLKREGKDISYKEMEDEARACPPGRCFIDPDAPEFAPMGDMIARVRDYCKKTGQYVPDTTGEVIRCIYDSLSRKYKKVLSDIESLTNKKYNAVHVVGGGVKDKLLCSLTAESCGVPVIAGPTEATVLGNVASQLIALGQIKDVKEARAVIKNGETPAIYAP